jgi:arsenite methyltransferase
MTSTPPRRGAYGVDAPYAPLLMALGGTGMCALLVWRLWHGEGVAVMPYRISIAALGFGAVWLFLKAVWFVYATRAGKFAVWSELLDRLELKGDERLLDIGCGRGAVLLSAAQRLPRGRAVGVDVWSTTDQSGNAVHVTRQNAVLEGVAQRVELHTADMRELPFDDGSFDVVWSARWRFTTSPARASEHGRCAKRPACSRRVASSRLLTSGTRASTPASSRPAG